MATGFQTDLKLLDFSKAFGKVAHKKLLLKLHYYGIRGDVLKCIKNFLDNRKQAVVIHPIISDSISVSSGVPQGSVLKTHPLFGILNDLPEQVKSKVRLFSDNVTGYRVGISYTCTRAREMVGFTGSGPNLKTYLFLDKKMKNRSIKLCILKI